MARVTPSEFADKWRRNLTASTPDIQRSVERMTDSPTEKAAQRADAMVAGVQEAVRTGKWQRRLRAVTLNDWRDKMVNVGIPRIAGGANAAVPLMETFADQLLPFQDNLMRELETMPDTTLEENIQRMTWWIRQMAGFEFER